MGVFPVLWDWYLYGYYPFSHCELIFVDFTMNLLFDFIKYSIKFWTIRISIFLVIVIGTVVLLNHLFDLQFLFVMAMIIYAFVKGEML